LLSVLLTCVRPWRSQSAQLAGYSADEALKRMRVATVDYEHDVGSGAVDASLSASYSSTVYHDIFHMMKQSPYIAFNAQAGYTCGDSGLRMSVYGRNITNKAYIANGFSSGQGFTVAYARPREIGLSVNYAY
jgi:iron complex outermembrane receptor protein